MCLRLQLKLLAKSSLFFAAVACGISSAASRESGAFRYAGCSNSNYAPPLVECTELNIDNALRTVSINGRLELGLTAKPDRNFYVLRSHLVPIVIPKSDYDSKDEWVYDGRKYIKIKKNASTLTEGEKTDVIAVVDNIESIKDQKSKLPLQDAQVLENTTRTFWYSPSRGVEAVSVGFGSAELQVYFCIKKPCLFAPDGQ